MSTSNTWGDVVSKIRGVSRYSDLTRALQVAVDPDSYSLRVRIPDGYWNAPVLLPASLYMSYAFEAMYRKFNGTVVSATSSGDWGSGALANLKYLTIDTSKIPEKHITFTACWSYPTANEWWFLTGDGICTCLGKDIWIDQYQYKYYAPSMWDRHTVLWLPCGTGGVPYSVAVYYILTG